LLEEPNPRASRLDEAKRAQRRAERTWYAKGAAALDFLTGQRTSLVVPAERCQQRRGVGAPRAERRCTDFPLLLETAGGDQIFQRFVGVLGGRA
jgi:hypothetical protein